jgi:lipopolysaccharide export system permease protein
MSALCAVLNFEVAPRCRVAFKDLFYKPGAIRPDRLLRSGQNLQIKQNSIYVGKVAPDHAHLETIRLWMADKNGDLQKWIQAPAGTISYDEATQTLTLTLENAYGATKQPDGWIPLPLTGEVSFPIPLGQESAGEVPISDMTLRQLVRRIGQVETASRMPVSDKDQPTLKRHLKEMKQDLLTPLEVAVHRQIAFSFACVGFTLVGIPLGIRSNRRETSVGILIALMLLAIYYSFLILADAWTSHPERFPQLIMWLPNFIFQAIGGFLIWRSNKQG